MSLMVLYWVRRIAGPFINKNDFLEDRWARTCLFIVEVVHKYTHGQRGENTTDTKNTEIYRLGTFRIAITNSLCNKIQPMRIIEKLHTFDSSGFKMRRLT